ncbi:MAG: hypothetical protein LBS68_02495 [Puniceicoccales bacterium]|nr:hypothetical protein [Puniceicoccales bacterium]
MASSKRKLSVPFQISGHLPLRRRGEKKFPLVPVTATAVRPEELLLRLPADGGGGNFFLIFNSLQIG